MSGTKENGFSQQNFQDDLASTGSAVAEAPPVQKIATGKKKGDVTSWDAYRNWLTKVQAPEQKRSLPDPALFSFKGYRSWAEKIRRDWEQED